MVHVELELCERDQETQRYPTSRKSEESQKWISSPHVKDQYRNSLSCPIIVLLCFPCGPQVYGQWLFFHLVIRLESCRMIIPCQRTLVFYEILKEILLLLLLTCKCRHPCSTWKSNCSDLDFKSPGESLSSTKTSALLFSSLRCFGTWLQ